MRRIGQLAALLTVLAASAGVIHAAGTDAQKCAASKIKAESKKLGAKLKCITKAVSKGQPVDGTCLSNADTKFNTAVGKAETKGGCALTGDGPMLETLVDNDANGIASMTTTAVHCCANAFFGIPVCYYSGGDPNCLADFGTPGAANTVCDPATATCKAPPVSPGRTCSDSGLKPLLSSPTECITGPDWGIGLCTAFVVSFIGDPNESTSSDPNSVCPPDRSRAVK